MILLAPNGCVVEKTLENVQCAYRIRSWWRDKDGNIECNYLDIADIFWETAEQTTDHLGRFLFLDEHGEEWPESSLIHVEEDEAGEVAETLAKKYSAELERREANKPEPGHYRCPKCGGTDLRAEIPVVVVYDHEANTWSFTDDLFDAQTEPMDDSLVLCAGCEADDCDHTAPATEFC